MSPLIVVDPALGCSGTDSVLAEVLAGQKGREPLGICGNAEMDAALRHRLACSYDLVEAVFDGDPYTLARKAGGAGVHWDSIYRLVTGYSMAFERVLARWPGRPLRLLHPTLSWEHANALALAIRLLGARGRRLQHIALLGCSPGVDDAGQTLDPEKRLDFRVAFSALRDAVQVDFYASCREYSEAYRHLLGLPEPLPLHPCIIGDRSQPTAPSPGGKELLSPPFLEWVAGLPVPLDWQRSAAKARSSRPEPVVTGEGKDVVLFWKQNDSTLYGRRNDMVARYLASRSDIRRVLVVDAPIGEDRLATLAASTDPFRHDRWVAKRALEKLAGAHDSGKLAYSVFVHPSEGYGPDEQDRPGPAFLDAYEAFLREEFAHWGIDPAQALFWIYPRNFSLPPLLGRFSPLRVVVDIVDDHRAWPGLGDAEKTRLGEHYRELLGLADLALANCAPVREAMSALGRSPVLVPNGCDLPLPVHVDDVDEALQEHLAFTGRTLGFVGNLEAKIDTALLSRLAEAFPDCRLVLIGSTHANPEVLSLRRHPNVRLPGIVPYDRLGAWLSSFDVGLIPHRQMELTRYMNPLKAYVYLANGIPVVATAVPNVESVPGLLTLAPDPEAFVAAVATCLQTERAPRERFEAVSAMHSWASRLGPQLDALCLDTTRNGMA